MPCWRWQQSLAMTCPLWLHQGGAAREGMAGGLYLRRYLGAGLLLQAAVLYTLMVCLKVPTRAATLLLGCVSRQIATWQLNVTACFAPKGMLESGLWPAWKHTWDLSHSMSHAVQMHEIYVFALMTLSHCPVFIVHQVYIPGSTFPDTGNRVGV